MTRRLRIVVAGLALGALVSVTPPVAAAPTAYIFTRGYGTATGNTNGELAVRDLPIVEGTKLLLVNTDLWGHSISSDAWRAPNVRLFISDVIPFNHQAEVRGVDVLPPGRYAFHCANHMHMKGTIIVLSREGL
jgi:hypothetical protein